MRRNATVPMELSEKPSAARLIATAVTDRRVPIGR
jgi:hypothetical protein